MRVITFYSQENRRRLGLLQMADKEDLKYSLEPSGHPTDLYRAEASKIFKTPYWLVTEAQRRAAKQMLYRSIYS